MSLYHLLQNEDVIKNVMFAITYYRGQRCDTDARRHGAAALFRHWRDRLP